MSRWNLVGSHRGQPKARHLRATAKPNLEVLEDLTLPSASALTPLLIDGGPQVAAFTPSLTAAMEQWRELIATLQQDMSSVWKSLGQEVAYVQQQWSDLLGIHPNDQANVQNLLRSPVVAQPSSGSVSPGSTTTAQRSDHAQTSTREGGIGPLESPLLVGVDKYLWDPKDPTTDISASNAQNWLKNGVRGGVPGGKASDEVTFDPGNGFIIDGHGNADINWDQSKTFSTMHVGGVNAYPGLQTIKSGITIDLTGVNTGLSLDMPNASSNLVLQFVDNKAKFQVDSNATITNLDFFGNPSGQFIVNGGITAMAQAPGFTEELGVTLMINPGGTVNYWSNNTLRLTQDKMRIAVYGALNFDFGQNNGQPESRVLISNDGTENDYIDVEGGILAYLGRQNVADVITIPIKVNGGTFNLTVDQNSGKPIQGTLIIQGGNPSTNYVSVLMTGSTSTVQLSNWDTLECDAGYYQDSGTLRTTDTSPCTLELGADGAGTANIAGGKVWIDSLANTFGTLNVNGNLNMDGELDVSVEGYSPNNNPGTSDVLNVNGTLYLNPDTSSLYVRIYGGYQKGDFWVVITSSNQITGDFLSESNDTLASLTFGPPNDPEPNKYRITCNNN